MLVITGMDSKMKSSEVLVKWTGSKRLQAKTIISHFPKQIKTYYEPFLGSASILYVLQSNKNTVEKIVCSDNNEELIKVFEIVKTKPEELVSTYKEMWHKLQTGQK